jgi:excisionase family DNA binding protein
MPLAAQTVTRFSTGPPCGVPVRGKGWDDVTMPAAPRFLTLGEVAEILNTSSAQVYALVRRGELRAIKIGGRGQWRVEVSQLEDYIQRMYDEADTFVAKHPFVEARTGGDEPSSEEEPG